MAMLALPEAECREIFDYFNLNLPGVPVPLLSELSANYGIDALADLDPVDIVSILSPNDRVAG